jgi:NDP-sugar pyrophosphorylase family protein
MLPVREFVPRPGQAARAPFGGTRGGNLRDAGEWYSPVLVGAAAGLKAVILAGGKGTRLAPFTVNFPKPLMPLGDVPVVEVLMRRLIQFGVTDITLSLGHLAELMRAYFDHRQVLTSKIDLRFVVEEEPTGTAGSLALIDGLTTTFLAMNGDLVTDIDLDAFVQFHKASGAVLTIATHARTLKSDFGVMDVDDSGRVVGYQEKPTTTFNVSMGIYVYEPEALAGVKAGQYLDFPDLVLNLLADGRHVAAFVTDCLWLDIGRPDDFARAQKLFAETPNGVDSA